MQDFTVQGDKTGETHHHLFARLVTTVCSGLQIRNPVPTAHTQILQAILSLPTAYHVLQVSTF